MRALVTGAGGFVGAHLCARLIEDGWYVVGTVRPGSPLAGTYGAMTLVPVDLVDPVATRALAREADPDVVFLLAASRATGTPAERAATMVVNSASGPWVLDEVGPACRAVVQLGSSTEYAASDRPMDETTPAEPRGLFGATKGAGSLLVSTTAARRGLRAAVLRAFQIYGPGDHPHRFVPSVLRAARTGAVLPLTGPGMRRDWIHVDDVVEACMRAALADELAPGQVLNIGTGRQVANEELVAIAEQVTGRRITVDVGAHPGCPWDTGSWVSDPSQAAAALGWEAKITLEDGLARCWEAELG